MTVAFAHERVLLPALVLRGTPGEIHGFHAATVRSTYLSMADECSCKIYLQ